MKNLLLLLMSLTLVFMLFSCKDGCTDHTDSDGDGKCDVCDAEVKIPDGDDDGGEDLPPLALIENGEAKFQIVISEMSGSKILNSVNDFIEGMKKLNVDIALIKDSKEANIKDCEIIVGDVSSRGAKYDYDEHKLGIKGSVITRIDNKIIITAGSANNIIKAFEDFCEDVIGYKNGADKEDVANVTFDKTNEVLNIQDDYRVTAVKIGANEITGYTIAVDSNNARQLESAKLLQKTLYERAGYWLDIVTPDKASTKSIIFESCAKGEGSPAGESGFLIKTANGQLRIICAYDNALSRALNSTLISKITVTQGEYVLDDNKTVATHDISTVKLNEWNSIKKENDPSLAGNGATNDFWALKAIHRYANEGGQKVIYDGRDYYISETGGESIIIKTDVDFGSSEIVIDDTYLNDLFLSDKSKWSSEKSVNVFVISNDYDTVSFGASSALVQKINQNGGIKSSDTTLALDLGYDAFVIPYNDDVRMYKRWGSENPSETGPGAVQAEVMVVYKNNTIDGKTPVLFDFEYLTRLEVRRADTATLRIAGGTFVTYAACYGNINTPGVGSAYTNRGMQISRSNVVIDRLDHFVYQPTTDEDHWSHYNGFINVKHANNVEVKNTKLCGRRGTGTYDISTTYANEITFTSCTQYNMFDDDGKVYREMIYWGIMGSNYSKNTTFQNCTLSRFDAHAGIYNFSVLDCEIAFIKATGGGIARIENSTIYNHDRRLITLREDYGSFWDGKFIIKNVTFVSDDGDGFIIFAGDVHDVDFGFKSVLPSAEIEGLKFRKYNNTYFDPTSIVIYNVSLDTTMHTSGAVGQINTMSPADSCIFKIEEHLKGVVKLGIYDGTPIAELFDMVESYELIGLGKNSVQ